MDIKLPKLGEGADTGTVVNVLVSVGDQIAVDQPIIELESEKAVATIPSSQAGTVEKIHVQNGQKISAGALLLTVADGDSSKSAKPESSSQPSAPAASAAPAKAAAPASQASAGAAVDVSGVSLDAIPDSVPMPVAPPSVRFLAAQLGLDLRRVVSVTGGSKVSAAELKQYIETLQKLAAKASQSGASASVAKAPAAESIDFTQWGDVLKKPMSQLRKVIARRMSENWNAIPHVTQFDDVDMTNILALRKKYLADYDAKGVRLTVTPFILKAVVNALKQHQIFNSSLDEVANEVILKEYYHLGVAVDTDAGLLVPVIRNVDKKSILELSKEIAEVAEKARDRKLSPDDMRGGTFTISNQGAFGGGHFTPIVNKPEVAILGLGRSSSKAVVRDGKIEARPMMPIALSYDHRVIDGGNAARFTVDLVKAFESFDEKQVSL
jgi:pyruvate dehydrogenase E2 component (dihydrolipoamide acetyltransferase)